MPEIIVPTFAVNYKCYRVYSRYIPAMRKCILVLVRNLPTNDKCIAEKKIHHILPASLACKIHTVVFILFIYKWLWCLNAFRGFACTIFSLIYFKSL